MLGFLAGQGERWGDSNHVFVLAADANHDLKVSLKYLGVSIGLFWDLTELVLDLIFPFLILVIIGLLIYMIIIHILFGKGEGVNVFSQRASKNVITSGCTMDMLYKSPCFYAIIFPCFIVDIALSFDNALMED